MSSRHMQCHLWNTQSRKTLAMGLLIFLLLPPESEPPHPVSSPCLLQKLQRVNDNQGSSAQLAHRECELFSPANFKTLLQEVVTKPVPSAD